MCLPVCVCSGTDLGFVPGPEPTGRYLDSILIDLSDNSADHIGMRCLSFPALHKALA